MNSPHSTEQSEKISSEKKCELTKCEKRQIYWDSGISDELEICSNCTDDEIMGRLGRNIRKYRSRCLILLVIFLSALCNCISVDDTKPTLFSPFVRFTFMIMILSLLVDQFDKLQFNVERVASDYADQVLCQIQTIDENWRTQVNRWSQSVWQCASGMR